jgi:hypothetical protein
MAGRLSHRLAGHGRQAAVGEDQPPQPPAWRTYGRAAQDGWAGERRPTSCARVTRLPHLTTVVIERPNISLCRDATSKPPFALSSSRIGGDCESNNGQSFHSARKRKRGCGLHPHHPRSEKGCGFLRALLQSDEGGDTSAMSRTRPLAKTSIKFSSPIKSVATRRCRTTSF